MKECKKCQETKELTEFYKMGKYHLNSCKKCYIKDHNKHVLKYQYKKQGVYGIFSNEQCLYIGESKALMARISYHKSQIKKIHKNIVQISLYKSILQHSDIEFKILEETPNHKEREQYWITKLKPEYNEKIK